MATEQSVSRDGAELYVCSLVFIRVGGPYPIPGRWRVRRMMVHRIKRTGKLRLLPMSGKRWCDRWPHECFTDLQLARGEGPHGEFRRKKNQ